MSNQTGEGQPEQDAEIFESVEMLGPVRDALRDVLCVPVTLNAAHKVLRRLRGLPGVCAHPPGLWFHEEDGTVRAPKVSDT